jgi:hypothetical protein
MGALATVEELGVFMRLPMDTLDVDAAQAVLDGASALVVSELHQRLELVVGDVFSVRSPGGRQLLLPELPVLEVTEVRSRNAGDTFTTLDAGDYDVELGRVGVVWRLNSEWPRPAGGRGPGGFLEVTYSHGYATPYNLASGDPYDPTPERLPDTIATVVKRVAARGYVNPEAVLQETSGRSATSYGTHAGLYLSATDKADLSEYRPGGKGGTR